MLTSITIRNFKSYKEATLPLAPLTLLIGANASGKSNAVESLRLLQQVKAAQGRGVGHAAGGRLPQGTRLRYRTL